jgi:HEAT repeat protein
MMTSAECCPADAAEKITARVTGLAANLASRSPVVRERARTALVAIGKPAVPALVPLLAHRAAHVRWEAGKALCDISDPAAAAALVDALEDREADVRWVAGEALIALRRNGLASLLAALLRRAKSPEFCDGARHVCHALAGRRKLGPILTPVLAALRESEPEIAVPLAAYTALLKVYDLLEGR